VLRSSVREFVCSEAMHFLGVAVRRARFSLVGTGESVIRDMFYDGQPAPEPGAVVCRVAPSFVRFGQLPDPRRRTARPSCSSELADYVDPQLPELGPSPAYYPLVSRRSAAAPGC
jgi:uncharacterized protein YdiU (UPF0061 family)